MSTQTDTNLEHLVGPIEAPPCEHSQHGTHHAAHSGPATHYVKTICTACDHTTLKPFCAVFVAIVSSSIPTRCRNCRAISPAKDCHTILGPISGYLS